MKKQLSGAIILLLALGGCTALTEGPKLIWGQNVIKRAESLNWICVGTNHLGELINPITWFWTPPITYIFVQQENARTISGSSSDWLVQEDRIEFGKGSSTFYVRHDTANSKIAYIGDESTPETEIKERMGSPKWEEPKTAWTKNTLEWLKQGKPKNSRYCS